MFLIVLMTEWRSSVSDPDLVVLREAGCRHGEGALYLVMEEPLRSVGRRHLVAGHLGAGAKEHGRPGLARTLHLPPSRGQYHGGCLGVHCPLELVTRLSEISQYPETTGGLIIKDPYQ